MSVIRSDFLMLKPKTRWKQTTYNNEKVQQFQEALGIPSLVAKLLATRQFETIDEAKQFLHTNDGLWLDPFLLDGMSEAINRIQLAIDNNEHILIYGDYDCDGVSSTTILVKTFERLNAKFSYHIPNRFTEGYGLNNSAIETACDNGVDLIVTVDTGISGAQEVEYAQSLGIDVIVTDHHEPPPQLPQCVAVINPKKPNCTYPFKELAGAGVALKVAHALLGSFPEHLSDVATIGTIADLVPLIGENRWLAKKGLRTIQQTEHVGLQVLIEQAGIQDNVIDEQHIGFALGPRINASGRLQSALPALQLFLSKDREEAKQIVSEINDLNQQRQELVKNITQEAEQWITENYADVLPRVLVVANEGWHEGVLGIVASKLVEKYYLPTIVLTINKEKGMAKGSARSIEGFDMYKALSECREWLPHFGGHPMAAGMSMPLENVELVRTRLNQIAEQWLTDEDYVPITHVDLKCTVDDVSIEAVEELQKLAPFGVGNPRPMIALNHLTVQQFKQVGANSNHLKCQFSEDDKIIDGIGFGMGDLLHSVSPTAKVDIIGEPSINEWNGHRKPQLLIKDMRVQHQQYFDWRSVKNIQKQLQAFTENETLALCCFRDQHIQLDVDLLQKTQLVHVNIDGQIVDTHDWSTISTVILYDLPKSMAQLEAFCASLTHVQKICLMFTQQTTHFLSTVPNREHFKWYYGSLQKQQTFNLEKHGSVLAKKKGWSIDTVQFMTQVFLELQFVKMNEDNIVQLVNQPAKKDLSESLTYNMKTEEIELEQQLVYATFDELVTTIKQCMKTANDVNDVKQGGKAHGF